MYALYAFCRLIDDIADNAGSKSWKNTQLDSWQRAIATIYEGNPNHAITRALAAAHHRYSLPKQEFAALLEGCRMDAAGTVRLKTLDDLYQYVRCVAVSVGVLSMQIFGVSKDPSFDFAKELGAAFQITNILRDVQEDALRDRLYMPLELLQHHDVPTDSLTHMLQHENLASARTELANRALGHYDRSEVLLNELPRKRLRPAIIMRSVYWASFDRMAARGWQDVSPVRVGRVHRVWLAAKAVLAS